MQESYCKSIVLLLTNQTGSVRFKDITTMLMFDEEEHTIKGGGAGGLLFLNLFIDHYSP